MHERRSFTSTEKRAKLTTLTMLEGFGTIDNLLEHAASDSLCLGICTNEECTYTAEVEPDQDRGWCESCDTDSVASALILADLI